MKGVGEAGPEAVMPLSTLWNELDTRLLSALQKALADNDYGIQRLIGVIKDAITAGFRDVISCLQVEREGKEFVIKIVIDGKELSTVITPYVDEDLARRWELSRRYV